MTISNYICDCKHFDLSKYNYTYWEDRNVTSGEICIINYILENLSLKNKNILHVGVGNSFLYKKLKNNNLIYGITISRKELEIARNFNDNNYITFYCDKYSMNLINIFKKIKFDYIIDNNLKSYACCYKSFLNMFKNFKYLLNPNGLIITSYEGMNWQKKLIPKLTFNFKRFFHFKLKEVDNGNLNNTFTIEEAKHLSKELSLDFSNYESISYFCRKY